MASSGYGQQPEATDAHDEAAGHQKRPVAAAIREQASRLPRGASNQRAQR